MIQIGTRWPVGEAPPSSVPATLAEAIRAADNLPAAQQLRGQFWTLTWQERLPTARREDGFGLSVLRDGSVISLDEHDTLINDDWLEE